MTKSLPRSRPDGLAALILCALGAAGLDGIFLALITLVLAVDSRGEEPIVAPAWFLFGGIGALAGGIAAFLAARRSLRENPTLKSDHAGTVGVTGCCFGLWWLAVLPPILAWVGQPTHPGRMAGAVGMVLSLWLIVVSLAFTGLVLTTLGLLRS